MKRKATKTDELLKSLVEERGIKTREELYKAMSDITGTIMQMLLDEEFNDHMGYAKGNHEKKENNRNGVSSNKIIKTNTGEYEIAMPRDRNGSFDPIVVPKRKKILTDISETITLMYSKGNSVKDIKELIREIYKINVNEDFISKATKSVSEEVVKWQNRPLKEIYPFVYMDCLYVPVKEDLVSVKKAVYVALGIDIEGNKEVIGVWIGESESSSFWYGILDEIKERGVKDILFLSSDGVVGFKEALEQTFPHTTHQRCIVHITRNLVGCVLRKEYQPLCNDLKKIYKAINLECAKEAYEEMLETWKGNKILIKKLKNDIDYMYQLFEYPPEIRKVIYTTNPIESLNSGLRKVTNGKGSFVNETALMKVLYLRIQSLSEKWNRMSKANWPMILNQLLMIYGKRVEKYINI